MAPPFWRFSMGCLVFAVLYSVHPLVAVIWAVWAWRKQKKRAARQRELAAYRAYLIARMVAAL